jgi:hypothetical protein
VTTPRSALLEGARVGARALLAPGAQMLADLGFGRIAVSNTELPNMLAVPL